MEHLNVSLPKNIELGAVRRSNWSGGREKIEQDNGLDVINQRWSSQKRYYDISFPPSLRDDPVYLNVLDMWDNTEGGTLSFNFTDWTDGTTIRVRFETDLSTTGIATHLDHIETVTLEEVKQS